MLPGGSAEAGSSAGCPDYPEGPPGGWAECVAGDSGGAAPSAHIPARPTLRRSLSQLGTGYAFRQPTRGSRTGTQAAAAGALKRRGRWLSLKKKKKNFIF